MCVGMCASVCAARGPGVTASNIFTLCRVLTRGTAGFYAVLGSWVPWRERNGVAEVASGGPDGVRFSAWEPDVQDDDSAIAGEKVLTLRKKKKWVRCPSLLALPYMYKMGEWEPCSGWWPGEQFYVGDYSFRSSCFFNIDSSSHIWSLVAGTRLNALL
jgi:hypothetical protein